MQIDKLRQKYTTAYSDFFSWNGGNIHFQDTKEGDVVLVLIHGINSSSHTWNGWLEYLKPEFRCIAIDLPSFGLSDVYSHNAVDDYCDCLWALVNHLNIDQFHLVGSSMGGQMVLELFARHPSSVISATLIGSKGFEKYPQEELWTSRLARSPWYALAHCFPRSAIRKAAAKMFKGPQLMPDATQERYADMFKKKGYVKAFHNFWKTIGHPSSCQANLVRNLNRPTLVLWGEKDHVMPLRHAHEFLKLLPNGQLVTYPDLGHIAMEEDPVTTARDFSHFIHGLSQ